MLKANENITYSFKELEEVLTEVEIILQSLHRIGSFYDKKFINDEKKYRSEYEKETTRFVDDWLVCERLSKIRYILSKRFDNTLGEDEMDDLERVLENIKYWSTPGDMP